MGKVSRRDVVKTGILAPAAVAVANGMGPMGRAMQPEAGGEDATAADLEQAAATALPDAGRERLLLDFGWRFHFGNTQDPAKDFDFGTVHAGNFQKTGNFMPAGSIAFDDETWTPINLPHDWAIELPFTNDPDLKEKGYYPLGRKYPATSVGWYRRVFDLPAKDTGKRLTLEFDGAYREAMVVFNNFYIGRHSGGYDPFAFDVTAFANPGGRNVLLVRVDAADSDGWFYEGAGIYRHVWLVKTHPVHVRRWGTFIASDIQPGAATLDLRTTVENHGKSAANARLVSTILDPAGNLVGKTASPVTPIPDGGEQEFRQQVRVPNPALWSLEDRNLYRLVSEVLVSGSAVDRYETRFGIRNVHFDAQKGFFLNGKSVKLRGTCNHQDHAGIGVALPDAVQRYCVRVLKEMGCNAIRTSHNPPTPELLDACDELGVLVFDETRMMSSNPEGLSQFRDLICRDRNRPSVFMWSMGNEEGQANGERGAAILGAMKALAEQYDGTRPVSIAPTGAIGAGGLALCDVMGYNYMDPEAAEYHKTHPDKPVMGTETVSAVGTRGIYITDDRKGYVSSYDPMTTTGRASAIGWWSFCDANPWLSGGFVWTGFDYRGEPSPNGWPNISSQYGIIDTCGFPKDSYFYYQSWWTDKPVLHLFPHWNWPGYEGKEIAVWVYSNFDQVELLVNGKSLGTKEMKKNLHVAWNVPYVAGTIEARGYKDGKIAMATRRETTGAPAKLVMTADRKRLRADGEDVAMFAIAVQDAAGRVVPITDNEVTFTITGAGRLIGVGNGDPTDQQADKGSWRKAFSGSCMALVQSVKQSGSLTVEATSPGFDPVTVTISVDEVKLRPQVAVWQREVPIGSGATGLWRPRPRQDDELEALLGRTGNMVFALRQEGSSLTGTVEGGNINFTGGSDVPVAITDGSVNGDRIAFKAGRRSFTGTIKPDSIELEETSTFPWRIPHPTPAPDTPAIGPAPDGSDPSIGSWHMPAGQPVTLRRAKQ